MAVLGTATAPSSFTAPKTKVKPTYTLGASDRFSNKDVNADWYKSLGLDQGGDNEISAILKRLIPGLAEQAFSGQALRNELEPQRQGAVRGLVALGDPSQAVANASAAGQRLQTDSFAAGQLNANRLGQLGAGAGTQLGAVADAQNQGISGANRLMSDATSPEGQAAGLIAQLQAIQQAGGDPLEILMAMFAPLETRSNANKADKAKGGLGAIGGILGSILPSIGMPIPGMGGGKTPIGGGSNASSGVGNTGVPF